MKRLLRIGFPATRIQIPTFEISSRPMVKYSDLNVKRYQPLNRARQAMEEGVSIWQMLWEPDDEAV